jgi:hypothetical protein
MNGGGAPIVTTTDGTSEPIVWAAGAEGDDRLHGFRGDNGEELFSGRASGDGMSGLRHFATILVAGGRFYIAGDGRIFAFQVPHWNRLAHRPPSRLLIVQAMDYAALHGRTYSK